MVPLAECARQLFCIVLAAACWFEPPLRGLLASFFEDPLGGVNVELDLVRELTITAPVAEDGLFFCGCGSAFCSRSEYFSGAYFLFSAALFEVSAPLVVATSLGLRLELELARAFLVLRTLCNFCCCSCIEASL